jgi:hypothetical protein
VASFTVKIETSRLRDCVSSTASAMTPEHDSLTAKRVRIPVRGASGNHSAPTTQPRRKAGATYNSAPRRPLHGAPRRTTEASSRRLDLGVACSNPGHARAASSRRRAGPDRRHPAAAGGRCVTEPIGSVTHFRNCF